MGFFKKFEGKMEDTFEGAAGKMNKAPISPVQIMKKAEKQMRREKVVSAGRQYAPTLYTVLVNPDDDHHLFGFYPTLAGECETRLASAAADDGLTMEGQPLVRFIVDESLKHGKFDIIAEVVSAPIIEQLRAEEMQRYGMAAPTPAPVAAPAPAEPVPAAPAVPSVPAVPAVPATPAPAAVPAVPAVDPQNPFAAAAQQPQQDPFAMPAMEEDPFAMPANDPFAPSPMAAYEVQPGFGTPVNGAGAYPALNIPNIDIPGAPAVKPPLPYVPEDEIDYSINYGEYTFDSQNFEDYRKQEETQEDQGEAPAQQPEANAPAAEPAAPAAPAAAAPAAPAMGQPAYGYPQQQAQPQPYGYAIPNPMPAVPNPATVAIGAPQPLSPMSQFTRARLINIGSNRSYELATPRIRIGRDTSNDIVVQDLNASRTHAQLDLDQQGVWVLTDLGSTNGTLVNGMPVSRRMLQEGDRITLGITDFIFTLR